MGASRSLRILSWCVQSPFIREFLACSDPAQPTEQAPSGGEQLDSADKPEGGGWAIVSCGSTSSLDRIVFSSSAGAGQRRRVGGPVREAGSGPVNSSTTTTWPGPSEPTSGCGGTRRRRRITSCHLSRARARSASGPTSYLRIVGDYDAYLHVIGLYGSVLF